MRVVALLPLPLAAATGGLRDHPLAGESIKYLDGRWTASADMGLAIPATVPGDLLTDLQNAGVIGDPLYEMNFKNSSIWDDHEWTYKTTFDASSATGQTVLVFDGVKMGASVALNGKILGNVTDQFLRYAFPLAPSGALVEGENTLTVRFSKAITCDGRWMACTGGWDWAPYTTTKQEGKTTFTKGIWKSVYLVDVSSAAISHVVPHTFYKGAYAVGALQDGAHGGFDVRVRVHLWAPAAGKGTVAVEGAWGEAAHIDVSHPAGDSNVTLTLPASAKQVKLWWPAGAGAQPLYNVSASFAPSGGSAVAASRRIGFRTFAIVTGNDTDPAYVKASENADGTADDGMLFRVNGAPFFSRGANVIPMEELEGRIRADAHERMVISMKDGGFNTVRIWGGGIFPPDVFYDTCDELGILIYHDMQYARDKPMRTATQEAEYRHQVRRLSHHPSIALWDGCNECHVVIGTNTGIYATFTLTVVAGEDEMRSIWPSCPANGWKTGVKRLTSQPNGQPLKSPLDPAFAGDAELPNWGSKIETHGPYQHGNMWSPPVNKGGWSDNANPIPITPKQIKTGPGEPNVYASEFGCVVMSSFESMSPLLKPEHWALHGGAPDKKCPSWPCDGYNPMVERNYGCDNVIKKFFGSAAASAEVLNTTGEVPFKRQLYQCMLGQALEMKSNIETRRTENEFGIIVWQYNEIWPTGGWGSIEYGTPGKGQVLGGRWKPLQHFYQQHLYADVACMCGESLCVVKNDGITSFKGTALLEIVDLRSAARSTLKKVALDMAAGAGISEWFSIDTSKVDTKAQVLQITVTDAAGKQMSQNVATLVVPAAMTPPKVSVTASVTDLRRVEVTAEGGAALYVVLTTQAHGRFSDNAFLLTGSRTLEFVPFVDGQLDVLKKTIRVEDLSGNMV